MECIVCGNTAILVFDEFPVIPEGAAGSDWVQIGFSLCGNCYTELQEITDFGEHEPNYLAVTSA